MPYILNKTNGSVLATLIDASVDQTTDLKLVGRNFIGYGEIVNENLIRLLENFANKSAPEKPLTGQLWFDTINKTLKVFDSKFKTLAMVEVSTTQPSGYSDGHLWFNPTTEKLYIKNQLNETGFSAIGPFVAPKKVLSSDGQIYEILVTTYIVNGENKVFEVVSNNSFELKSYTLADRYDNRPLYDAGFRHIEAGLTVVPSMYSASLKTSNITTGNSSSTGNITGKWALTAGSTLEATFADLAERYFADNKYEPGTVVVIGGECEITVSSTRANVSVAGIISSNPAYKLNSAAGDDSTHPYVALRGRVPCKVLGNVSKGDQLVTSAYPGYAEVKEANDDPSAVLGIALEDFIGHTGVIEVKV